MFNFFIPLFQYKPQSIKICKQNINQKQILQPNSVSPKMFIFNLHLEMLILHWLPHQILFSIRTWFQHHLLKIPSFIYWYVTTCHYFSTFIPNQAKLEKNLVLLCYTYLLFIGARCGDVFIFAMVCMWKSDGNFWESVLYFTRWVPRIDFRLSIFPPLSHITCPGFSLKLPVCFLRHYLFSSLDECVFMKNLCLILVYLFWYLEW